MRRIVVTGMGAVTPLAAGVEASWSRLLAGRSGIRRLSDDVVEICRRRSAGWYPLCKKIPTPVSIPMPSWRRRISAR